MNYSKDGSTKTQKNLKSKNKKIFNKINITILRALLISIVLVMIVGAGAALGAFKGIIEGAPDINLVNIAPEGYGSTIYDLEGNEITRIVGAEANRIYVESDQIPKHVKDAFIAIEDKRFWDHNGIDIEGIFRAIFVNLKSGSMSEGASTITQQLLKNNVLTADQTIERKVQEQYLAIQLEKKVSKEKILESYLNTINLGSGSFGIQAAANRYFNKDVWDLTIAESAVIAAITQNPVKLTPVRYPDENKTRQQRILSEMHKQELITTEQYDIAINEDVYSKIHEIDQETETTSTNSYFVDAVIEQVINDLQLYLGLSEQQSINMVYRGGLSIYITQDLAIQKIVDDVILNEENYPDKKNDYGVTLEYRLSILKTDGTQEHFNEKTLQTHFGASNRKFDLLFKDEKDAANYIEEYKATVMSSGDEVVAERITLTPQPQASFVIIDHHTGQVKAIAGGRGEKTANMTLNRATKTTRQPGSTFKVLASFLPALDTAGFTLASVQDDVPFEYSKGKPVKNWYGSYKGLSTIREGIANSMNIVAVKTLKDITPQVGYSYVKNLGFTTVYDSYTDSQGNQYSDVNLSLALGGITRGVTNLELTAAYGAIANGGEYIEPTFYTTILDHDGKLLLEKNPEKKRVMKETTAFLLTNAMEDVIRSSIGTASSTGFRNVKMPIAGKTGTTSNNYDIWFSGYTPYYVASIWTGYDINTSIGSNKKYHQYMWRNIMETIHKELAYTNFNKPASIVTAKICTESGLLAVEGLCDHDPRGSTVRTEYFASGTEPKDPCNVHTKVYVCTETGLLANEHTPESAKVEKVFIIRPEKTEGSASAADAIYEMPTEYCPMYGPDYIPPTEPSDNEQPGNENGNNGEQPGNENGNNGNNGNGNNGNNGNGNGNNGNNGNGNNGNGETPVDPDILAPINILP